MIGAVLVQTSPSRIMYAFERAKLPRPITVMLCILIRFFPVLLMEIFAIRDGIRARGIFPRWHSALRRPVVIYECYFVPLMVRCLKLSSELASSAELRGIESRNNRSTIHLAELRGMDAAAVALYAMLGAMTVAAGGNVL
ncbi:Energy-coupling factor transporter transmembrane protein EcfT [compost metagenome]